MLVIKIFNFHFPISIMKTMHFVNSQLKLKCFGNMAYLTIQKTGTNSNCNKLLGKENKANIISGYNISSKDKYHR